MNWKPPESFSILAPAGTIWSSAGEALRICAEASSVPARDTIRRLRFMAEIYNIRSRGPADAGNQRNVSVGRPGFGRVRMRVLCFVLFASALLADELPIVANVEFQPLAAQVERVADALEMTGEPLPAAERADLRPRQDRAGDPEDPRPPLPGGHQHQSGKPRQSAGRSGQSRS